MARTLNENGGSKRSVAIWYRRDTQNPDAAIPKLTTHFNLWRFGPDNSIINDFIDIGIQLENIESIKDFTLFFPFKITTDQLLDLSAKFHDRTIITGIFNENLNPTPTDHGVEIRRNTNDPYILVHETEKESETTITPHTDGTKITLNETCLKRVKNNLETANFSIIYFRLRINFYGKTNHFVNQLPPADRGLLSGYDNIEYVDFRLNEARNLPLDINREINDQSSFLLNRVDFLLAANIRADLIGRHEAIHKYRVLENDIWSRYVGNENDGPLKEGMLIYHSSKVSKETIETGNGIRDFNAFIKLNIRISNKKTMFLFLMSILILGAIGSYLSDLVERKYLPIETFLEDSSDVKPTNRATQIQD